MNHQIRMNTAKVKQSEIICLVLKHRCNMWAVLSRFLNHLPFTASSSKKHNFHYFWMFSERSKLFEIVRNKNRAMFRTVEMGQKVDERCCIVRIGNIAMRRIWPHRNLRDEKVRWRPRTALGTINRRSSTNVATAKRLWADSVCERRGYPNLSGGVNDWGIPRMKD